MNSPLQAVFEGSSLRELGEAWGLPPHRVAERLRAFPFLRFAHPEARGGGRGRPARRVALDPAWRFRDHAGRRPLTRLVDLLTHLHEAGEPFALGAPFTSALWRPFLHPEARVYAPPETVSAWRRLFHGPVGALRVHVEPPDARLDVREVEGLPLLSREAAVVDAVRAWERVRNGNLLALADALGHRAEPERALALASRVGLVDDVALVLHRARRCGRAVTPRDAAGAHASAREMEQLPPVTFRELVESREAYR